MASDQEQIEDHEGPGARAAIRRRAVITAAQAIQEAAARARLDPTRPAYHFRPKAGWMNDPNGPIQFGGYYHLFYQQNPFDEKWGDIHWGHARSKDLVYWDHLPIALWPDRDLGEDHCFSGSTVAAGDRVLAFYTSVGPDRDAKNAAVQCVAASRDPDLVTWEKQVTAPVLSEAVHGDLKIYEWRDPFLFRHGDDHYMVLGGSLRENLGGQGVVPLYRARDATLTDWAYVGILFQHPDEPGVPNIECPNFFELDGRWVLFFSPHGQVVAFVGDFDSEGHRFRPEHRGQLDLGERAHFYAPIAMADDSGRRLVFGWIGGFEARPDWAVPGGRGWNGCLALPRVLSVRPDGVLAVQPAAEVEALRERKIAHQGSLDLGDSRQLLAGAAGDCLEIAASFQPGDARRYGLVVRRSADGARGVPIAFDGESIEIAGYRAPFRRLPGEDRVDLRVFLDRSVVEVFINGRAALTRVIDAGAEDVGVEVFAEGGAARVEGMDVWAMKTGVVE